MARPRVPRMQALGRALVLIAVAAAIAIAVGARAPASHVAVRLGARDFASGSTAPHAPVATIAGETREVLAMPTSEAIADFRNVRGGDAPIRLDLQLPARLAASDAPLAFRLTAIGSRYDVELPPDTLAAMTASAWWKELAAGWSVRRSADDRSAATLELTMPAELRSGRLLLLRLSALGDLPRTFESRELSPPDGSVLELGYGLAPSATVAGTPVTFRAALACGDDGEQLLFRDRLVPGTARAQRWRDVSIPLAAAGRAPCRLRLTAETDAGQATPLALWTPARFRVPSPPGEEPPNLVLISLDTLRADHLSGYGYARPTSPAIDARLVRDGTTFADAMTTFPMTDVAHLSLFTALFPGALPPRARLQADSPIRTLAEQLRDAGFETTAFTEDALLAGSSGFWFGFDRFVERNVAREPRGRPTFAAGVRHLRERGGRRFFLFLHTYQVHAPYGASPGYDRVLDGAPGWDSGALDGAIPLAHRGDVDRYDRAIREGDDLVRELLDELDRQGLAERTIVVLLSDHGEAFGEHGFAGHGFAAQQEQLRIPLVMRGPGVPAGRRIDRPVSIVDVAPTLLRLVGAPPLGDVHGIDLTDAVAGGTPPDRPLFFSWLPGEERVAGVRRGSLKLLEIAQRARLFDLATDPGERRALDASSPALVSLQAALVAYRADNRVRVAAHRTADESDVAAIAPAPEVEEALRALGYLAEREAAVPFAPGDTHEVAADRGAAPHAAP